MRKLHIDDTDLAQHALLNHMACLMNHLRTGVAVSYAHNAVVLFCQSDQFIRLLIGKAKRFLTDGMQSGLKRSFQNLIV